MPISWDQQMLKSWKKVFFHLLINCNHLHILFTPIPNFNFSSLMYLKQVSLFMHHILLMIRLFNSKRNKFWVINPYIFGKYSLRAFQWYVTLCPKCALCQKLQKRHFIPKRCLNANILRSANAKELKKRFFFMY